MNIIDTVKKRKSCRTFSNIELSSSDKTELESFISNVVFLENENVSFKIFEKKTGKNNMILDYGMIQGHNAYILGNSKITMESRVNYGYALEKIVLKATEMNLATCWVGYFDKNYFNVQNFEDGFDIPAIIVIGYSELESALLEKFVRFSVNAAKRKSWDKLFFNYKLNTPLDSRLIKKYSDSLEMLRLAPSSGNTQPWRIYFDNTIEEFHFFKLPINKKYEQKGLHDIDLGIALCHFELTTSSNGLPGGWIKHNEDNIDPIKDMQYIMSWKCE